MGLAAATYTQPFPSFQLDTTRYIGRDLRSEAAATHWPPLGREYACLEGNCRAARSGESTDTLDGSSRHDSLGRNRDYDGFSFVSAVAAQTQATRSRCGAQEQDKVSGSLSCPWEASGDRVPVDTEVGDLYSLALAARPDRYALVCDGTDHSSK